MSGVELRCHVPVELLLLLGDMTRRGDFRCSWIGEDELPSEGWLLNLA